MGRNLGDVAVVVGGGIVGLAHALAFARHGSRVIVCERSARALGASVRNFGLIWPVGQPAGERLEVALESRAIWDDVCARAGIPALATGSIHLAYHPDELAVIEEFVARGDGAGYSVRMLTADEVGQRAPHVVLKGLLGGLSSDSEITVEPRRTLGRLPAYLAETYGVEMRAGTAVTAIEGTDVIAGGERIHATHVVVASGDDFATLFPSVLARSGLIRCKLQMMRTAEQPAGFALGSAIAGGLTLGFYESFRACTSLAVLQARFAAELPDYERHGIHVMASQTPEGQVTIGDSHVYGATVDPFDDPRIDDLILAYLSTFLRLPDPTIVQRWQGVYAKHPERPWFSETVEPGVRIVTGLGGAGMTLSFGLAARTVAEMVAA